VCDRCAKAIANSKRDTMHGKRTAELTTDSSQRKKKTTANSSAGETKPSKGSTQPGKETHFCHCTLRNKCTVNPLGAAVSRLVSNDEAFQTCAGSFCKMRLSKGCVKASRSDICFTCQELDKVSNVQTVAITKDPYNSEMMYGQSEGHDTVMCHDFDVQAGNALPHHVEGSIARYSSLLPLY